MGAILTKEMIEQYLYLRGKLRIDRFFIQSPHGIEGLTPPRKGKYHHKSFFHKESCWKAFFQPPKGAGCEEKDSSGKGERDWKAIQDIWSRLKEGTLNVEWSVPFPDGHWRQYGVQFLKTQ